MLSVQLAQARLRRDLAISAYWVTYESPNLPGQREARLQKAAEAVATADAEATRLWRRQELARLWREMRAKSGGNDSGHPVVGSVPAVTPKPYDAAKGASDPHDPNPVEAEHVKNQLRKNYPEKALAWMDAAVWIGPVQIPLDRIDMADEKSWAAAHQSGAVRRFTSQIRAGTGRTDPVVMIQEPGKNKANVVDGHHRTLAYQSLKRPVPAYVGFVPEGDRRWEETHSSQVHQGSDRGNR